MKCFRKDNYINICGEFCSYLTFKKIVGQEFFPLVCEWVQLISGTQYSGSHTFKNISQFIATCQCESRQHLPQDGIKFYASGGNNDMK